jgi:chromosome segregation ATPase
MSTDTKEIDVKAIAAALQAGSNHYKMFKDAAEFAESVHSLESYKGELDASIKALGKQSDETRAAYNELVAEWDAETKSHDKAIQASTAKADQIIKDAITKAESKAKAIVDAAEAQAASLSESIKDLKAEKSALTGSIAVLSEQNNKLTSLVGKAKEALGV